MIKTRSYIPRWWIGLGTALVVLAGGTALLLTYTNAWWGHLGLFVGFLTTVNAWASVLMSFVGASLVSWPNFGRFNSWTDLASIGRARTFGPLLMSSFIGVTCGYLLLYLAGLIHVVAVNGFLWPAIGQLIALLSWDLFLLFLGAAIAHLIRYKIPAIVISIIMGYILGYLPVYFSAGDPIYELGEINANVTATMAESTWHVTVRIAAYLLLASFCAALALAKPAIRWTVAVVTSVGLTVCLTQATAGVTEIPGSTNSDCQTINRVNVCVDAAHRATAQEYREAIAPILAKTPDSILPKAVKPSGTQSTPQQLIVGFATARSSNAQRLDPEYTRYQYVQELIGSYCQDSDALPFLTGRLQGDLGILADYSPPWGGSITTADGLEGDNKRAMTRLLDTDSTTLFTQIAQGNCPTIKTLTNG